MKRERAGNADTLMHRRGADNPAANNPKNPDFREKKKGGGGGGEKFIQEVGRAAGRERVGVEV